MSTIATEKPADAIKVIDVLSKKYAEQRAVLAGYVTDFNIAVEQLRRKHLPAIRVAAAKAADLQGLLSAEISRRPDLFVQPKTITLHGIKLGFQKGKGKVAFDDQDKLIERIRAQLPKAQAEALLKTETSPILNAIAQLDGATLKKLGVRIEDTGEVVYIKAANGEVDKIVAKILTEGAVAAAEGKVAA